MTTPIPNRPPRVLALGEVLWDVFPTGRYLGGAPLNFACACAGLGAESLIASRVGADEAGTDMRADLARLPVDVSLLQTDESRPTGSVLVSVDENGTPNYRIVEGVAWDALARTQELERAAATCDIVYFGTLAQRSHVARETITRALTNVPNHAVRVCDVNLRMDYFSPELLRSSLLLATVAKFTAAELVTVARNLDLPAIPEAFAQAVMQRYGVRCVVVTDGARGAAAWTVTETAQVAGLAVEVADTLGTGDAFLAAFVLEYAKNDRIGPALKVANLAGAFTATQPGAQLTLTRDRLRDFATPLDMEITPSLKIGDANGTSNYV